MHDPIFLAGKSEVATKEDLQVAQDLLDTLMVHRESCVGMAANMIGMRKRIIASLMGVDELLHIQLCSIPKSSRKKALMIPKKVVYLFSASLVSAGDIRPSRFNIKPWRCRCAPKTSQAGRLKSFSMRWMIAMEC